MTVARKVSFSLILLDALAVIASFNVVAWLRGLLPAGEPIVAALLLPVIIHWLGVYLIDGYSRRTDMMSITYASLHVIAQIGILLVTLLLTYVFIPPGFQLQSSRFVTAVSYLAVIPLSLGYRRFIYQRRAAARRGRHFIFIGTDANLAAFIAECRQHGMPQTVLHARHGTSRPATPDAANEILGLLAEHEGRLEAIVIRESGHELPPEVAQRLVQLSFSGVPTYTLELFHQVYWRKIPLYRLNQTWLFQEGFQIAREPVFERLKRVWDITFAAAGLLLFLPLFPFVAAAIWLTDRGPVFFHQTRVGRHRVLFEAYKFRTMRLDHGGDPYTRKGDSRVTAIGRFLRASRIDEVPQLLNVLRGDMSLIGPRAEWLKLVEEYERQIPCYHFRHLVKPGITGWAQVNYPYGAGLEDTLRKLEYDLYYIRFFSFVLDASIVLKTIHVMLFGKGR